MVFLQTRNLSYGDELGELLYSFEAKYRHFNCQKIELGMYMIESIESIFPKFRNRYVSIMGQLIIK